MTSLIVDSVFLATLIEGLLVGQNNSHLSGDGRRGSGDMFIRPYIYIHHPNEFPRAISSNAPN